MEISQVSIENSTLETTTKLTDDLLRLLQVREKNLGMAKDWLFFLKTSPKISRLRPGEIFHAFKMALSREILDSKGEEINILPELSTNTTGKVLYAFIDWKQKNDEYQQAKSKLKSVATDLGPSEEEKAKLFEDFLIMVFEEIKKNGFSNDAWQLFEKLESKITISIAVAKRLYKIQNKKYIKELEQEVSGNSRPYYIQVLQRCQKNSTEGKPNPVVQNKCRSIVVCNYLKKFEKFNEFKNEFKP